MTQPPDWSPLDEPSPQVPRSQPPPPTTPLPPTPPPPAPPTAFPAPPPPAPGYGGPGEYGAAPTWGQPGVPPGYGPPPGYGAPPSYGAPGYGRAAGPRPGIIPLRPLTLGEIYDGSFQAIRTNPRTMIGFSAVVLALTYLITTVPQAYALNGFAGTTGALDRGDAVTGEELLAGVGASLTAAIVPAIVQFLVLTVLNALLVVAVSAAVLGQRMAPGELWARTRHRLWAVLGLSLLTGLAFAAIAVVGVLPGILLLVAGQDAAGGVALLVGIPAVLVALPVLWVRWSLSGPALLLEEQGVIAALRRSWRLVAGSSWRVFGILLLTQIVVGVGSSIIAVPFGVVAGISGSLQASDSPSLGATLLQLLFANLGNVIAGSVFYPFAAAVTALLYVDLRMRREGLDVQLLRAAEQGAQPS